MHVDGRCFWKEKVADNKYLDACEQGLDSLERPMLGAMCNDSYLSITI